MSEQNIDQDGTEKLSNKVKNSIQNGYKKVCLLILKIFVNQQQTLFVISEYTYYQKVQIIIMQNDIKIFVVQISGL